MGGGTRQNTGFGSSRKAQDCFEQRLHAPIQLNPRIGSRYGTYTLAYIRFGIEREIQMEGELVHDGIESAGWRILILRMRSRVWRLADRDEARFGGLNGFEKPLNGLVESFVFLFAASL